MTKRSIPFKPDRVLPDRAKPTVSHSLGAVAFGTLTLLASVYSQPVQALALGRIVPLSYYSEPVLAEIDVLSATPEELSSLQIALTSPDSYKNLNLEYSSALSGMSFTPKSRNGKTVIEIRGSKAPNDVFLDIVLEISSVSGKMQRHFTLLLNPANANDSGSAQTSAASTSSLGTVPSAASVAKPNEGAASSTQTAQIAPPLENKKSLPPIASNAKGMKKAGTTKRSDSATSSKLVLSSATPTKLTPALRALEKTTQATSQILILKMSAELTLPKGKPPSPIGAGSQPTAAAPSQSPASSPLPASSTASGANATAPVTSAPASGTATQVTASAPVASTSATAVNSAPAPVATASSSAAPPKISEESWFSNLMDSDFFIPGALAALLTLLAGLFFYKRNQKPANSQFDDSLAFFEQAVPSDATKAVVKSNAAANGSQPASKKKSTDAALPESSFTVPPPPLEIDTISYSPSKLMTDDDVDPVLEADVYISYNRSEQAEKILQHAITQTPDNPALHAKLLEIFAQRHDGAAFTQTLATLEKITKASGSFWEHAVILNKTMEAKETNLELEADPVPLDPEVTDLAALADSAVDKNMVKEAATAKAPQTLSLELELEQPIPTVGSKWNATVQQAKISLVEELLLMGDKAGARPILLEMTQKGDASAVKLAKQQLAQL